MREERSRRSHAQSAVAVDRGGEDEQEREGANFDDAAFNRKLRAASLLSGDAHYATYGSLDAELMSDAAPIAPIANSNNLVFVSKRVGCFTYSNVYSVDLAALCLK